MSGKKQKISIKVLGIDHVALNVRDLDKSVAFYTRVFGLKVTRRETSKPGIEYFLDCGDSLLGIIQAKDFKGRHPFSGKGLGANHFSFRIRSGDFSAMLSRLEVNHVRIEYAKKRPFSWSVYFYDIDGNKLEATCWPVEDGVPKKQRVKEVYDCRTRAWKPYQ